MTKLLEQAFAQAAKLTQAEQDALAAILLDELESEKRWAETFAKSQDKLAQLANEALEEFKTRKTEPLDPDRL